MTIKRTARPLLGGVFTLVSGGLGALGIISYMVGLGPERSGFGQGDMPPFVPSIIFGMSIPALIICVLALAGGIFAIKRRKWWFAMAGSIAAALSFILLGIPAIILIALSREEFDRGTQVQAIKQSGCPRKPRGTAN